MCDIIIVCEFLNIKKLTNSFTKMTYYVAIREYMVHISYTLEKLSPLMSANSYSQTKNALSLIGFS